MVGATIQGMMMRTIDEYSDEELQILLAKTVNVKGGKDRVNAIRSALDARGIEDDDGRAKVIDSLTGTIEEQSKSTV